MRAPFPSASPRLRATASLLSVTLTLTLTFTLTFIPTLRAQEVKSRPVGFLTQTIPAGQTRSFSVPFDAETTSLGDAVGRLTAVGADYLENSAAAWTPGAFSQPGAPYYVRLTSGPQAGRTLRIISPANTATRIYAATDEAALATLGLTTGEGGTTFEIMPGDTLATFFGTTAAGDSLAVEGGADALTADVVQVWGTAAWLNFYYNTAWQRWARDTDVASDPSRNGFLLRPDRGLMITRRGTTPLELAVVGRVLATPPRAHHMRDGAGLTFLATMQAADVTLAELGLQLGSRSVAWRSGSDATQADHILVWSGTTWLIFYFNDAAGHWQRSGDPANRDDFVIVAGTPIFVRRPGAAGTVEEKTITFPAPGT